MHPWIRSLYKRFRHRVTHTTKFPKGDLISSLLNLEDRGFRPRHIIDVGANHGKWSRKAHRIFPDCVFTLVEPQIEMKPFLEEFCQRVPGSRWIQAGAAAASGHLSFTVIPDTVSSTFTLSEEQAEAEGFHRRLVSVVTLDELVQDGYPVPDLVKIDAEGFEAEVMKGASSLIGKTELFLLEAPLIDPPPRWLSFAEIVSLMVGYGYEPYDFTSFQKRPYDGALGLCEIAFARKRGILREFGGWDARVPKAA
ncbi:MAG: FkbM family methyltransferase [Pirellulales bacterium]